MAPERVAVELQLRKCARFVDTACSHLQHHPVFTAAAHQMHHHNAHHAADSVLTYTPAPVRCSAGRR